jgi:4-hydroxybenzoate polyprenyltransferase
MLTSKSMGIALWMACAAAVFFAIRYIRFGRPVGWIGELLAIVIGALLLGGVATALDFGGWNEIDWRAGLFVLFGSFAISGASRLGRLFTRRRGDAEKGT